MDYTRLITARGHVSHAVDTAVLAGAHVLAEGGTEKEAIKIAREFYDSNLAANFEYVPDTIKFGLDDSGTIFTGTGNAYIKTTLMALAGIEKMPIFEDPAADFPGASIPGGSATDIEIALMLDITGSMCPIISGSCYTGPKIDALKLAATELMNMVVQDDQTTSRSRMALVPFNKRIRVAMDGEGTDIMKKLTNLDPTWSGWRKDCVLYSAEVDLGGEIGSDSDCLKYDPVYMTDLKLKPSVTERYYESTDQFETTDRVPGPGYWINAYDGTRKPLSEDSSDTPATEDIGDSATNMSTSYNYNSKGDGYGSENNVIVPLTSDKVVLREKIDSLKAQGVTAGGIGTAFTWYMLSPNWTSIWPAASAPDPYTKITNPDYTGKTVRKVAVMMTDGLFNSSHGDQETDPLIVSKHATDLCAGMKAKGIEIFTIGFALDELTPSERSRSEDTLKTCGSDIQHFYNTFNPEQLVSAFKDIGSKFSDATNIRLTR